MPRIDVDDKAPAVVRAVAAASGRGRNLSGLNNPESTQTIPAGGMLVPYGSALFGRGLARGVAESAARRAADQASSAVGIYGDIGRQLGNRAHTARRLPGGDPWTESLRQDDSAPTTVQLAAWSAASADLSGAGYTPIIPAAIARDLWRLGGAERELMERVHRAGGIAE